MKNSDHRITGSPDHRITGSPDHRITGSPDHRLFVSAVGCCLMLAAVGCDPRASNSPDVWQEGSAVAEAASVDAGSSIDAGIVVAGRPGYLCLPLERIGLAAGDEAVRLETSCSCLRGRLVSYITAGDSLGQAILLEYVDEQPAPEPAESSTRASAVAVNLGVTVEVHLRDGRTHEFTVRLLHTVLV